MKSIIYVHINRLTFNNVLLSWIFKIKYQYLKDFHNDMEILICLAYIYNPQPYVVQAMF